MNRYVISGASADAQSGKAVIVCTRRASEHLDDFAAADGVAKVYRANGQQRVDFLSGGYVRLMNLGRDSLRGASVDVVFVDHDAPGGLTEDAWLTIVARGGEVVRA